VDAVINVSGENILNFLRPWTAAFKEETIRSRVDTTALLRDLVAPTVRVQVLHDSRIGRYPPSDSLTYDEASVLAKETTDFPSKLCAQIEEVNK